MVLHCRLPDTLHVDASPVHEMKSVVFAGEESEDEVRTPPSSQHRTRTPPPPIDKTLSFSSQIPFPRPFTAPATATAYWCTRHHP
jgi:hypothetical protein